MWIPEMTLHCLAIISFQCQSTSSYTGAWAKPITGQRLYPIDYSNLLPSLPSVGYDNDQYSTLDCLEGFRVCNSKQWICKIDLDIFRQFCGDWRNEKSLLACPRAYFKECRSALNTVLLGRPNLKHCTCDGQLSRSIEEMAQCNLLRRNLNHHPCLPDQPVFDSQVDQASEELPSTFRNDSLSVQVSPDQTGSTASTENEQEQSQATTSSPPQTQSNITEDSSIQSPDSSMNRTERERKPPTLEDAEVPGQAAPARVDDTPAPPATTGQRSDNSSGLPAGPPGDLKSCLVFLDGCTERPGCARALNNFRAVCNIRSCARLRLQCGKAHKELQKYVNPWNCTCSSEESGHAKQRCHDYRVKITQNKCVAEWNASVGVDDEGDDDASTAGLIEEIDSLTSHQTSSLSSSPHREPSDCFTVFMDCLRNTSCLRWYLKLFKSCSPGNCTEPMVCETHLPTPTPLGAALATHVQTCQCPSNDQDCLRQQNLLHMRCSMKPQVSAKHCLNLWMKCRLNENCRQVYGRLATDCQLNTGQACTSDPVTCFDLHRQLVGHSETGFCHCGPSNDVLARGHWITGACADFQKRLNEPPCSDNANARIPAETGFAMPGTKMLACEVTQKLHLPSTRVVKLQIDEGVSQRCYAFCTCELGCTRRTCLSTKSTSDIPEHLVGLEPIERHFTELPWLEFPAVCLYLPSFDRTCICIKDRLVKCTRSVAKKASCGKDIQVEIEYEIAQLTMILSTKWERNVGDRIRQIFQLVYMLVDQLGETVQRAVGNTECRLVPTEYRWLGRGNRSRHGHTRFPPAINSSDGFAGLELRPVFTLAAVAGAEDTDCNLVLRLVQTIVNERLPQMVYHPLLSALQSARMIDTTASGEHCKGTGHSPFSQSLQSWRKPRSEGQRKVTSQSARTAGLHYASAIPGLFSCLWYTGHR